MFYLKLALNNIKNSFAIFAPFLLASLVLYIMTGSSIMVLTSPVTQQMKHGTIALGLSTVILTLLSIIMEIYSFNFLLKQRTREFGLYNMLGMRKGQVALVASLELIVIAVALVGVGSLVTNVFANLFYLMFARLTNYDQLNFSTSLFGFILTALVFLGIFAFLIVLSWIKIGKSSPLVLFRTNESGEQEPRGNWLLALLSLLAIGGGYALSLTSSKVAALAVLIRFFFAVLLVIIGTYLFYIAFVTWFLKRRRANKTYFYQPEHFIRTSQMIFRMKQHATGLANITILAVMSFVAIATTTSLYSSVTSQVNKLYPRDVTVTLGGNSRAEVQTQYQQQIVEPLGYAPKNAMTYMSTIVGFNVGTGKQLQVTEQTLKEISPSYLSFVILMSQEDFRALGNELPQLKRGETAFWLQREEAKFETIDFLGLSFRNVKNFKTVTVPATTNLYSAAVWVFSSDDEIEEVATAFVDRGGFKIGGTDDGIFNYIVHLDLTPEEQAKLSPDLNLENKTAFLASVLSEAGGFVFSGFFLSTAFLLGAALIIYYKQYNEGIEDKKSYHILQEVGMSRESVKKTINSQVLTVFFMPITLAVVHFLVALTMIKQMLLLFGITNSNLIYLISAIAVGVILIIYFVIYRLTSKVYYRLVER